MFCPWGVFITYVQLLPTKQIATYIQAGTKSNEGDGVARIQCVGTCQPVKRLGVPDERVVRTLRETGNISSACIPLALDRLANAGALHTGDTIALVGFGAGLDIGGYLLRWK